MIRILLDLDDEMHARLRDLAQRQGRTISDLTHDALTRTYGLPTEDRRLSSLRAIEGLWRDRDDIGPTDEYVRRLRGGQRRGHSR